jgi:uncharacterized protein
VKKLVLLFIAFSGLTIRAMEQETKPIWYWNMLPAELKYHILDNLAAQTDKLREFAHYELVDHEFKNLIDELGWKNIKKCKPRPQDLPGYKQEKISNGDLLVSACSMGHIKLVQLLLASGANPNSFDRTHETPLIKAVSRGHTKIVRLLISHKADVNEPKYKTQETPLFFAARAGHHKIVKLLLEADAQMHWTINDETPLIEAAAKGSIKTVELLLNSSRSFIDEHDKRGRTPLITASEVGHPDMVSLLLAHNASINRQNKEGKTALMIAVENNNKRTAVLLLDHNANVNDRNKLGETVLMAAIVGNSWFSREGRIEADKKEIVELLISRGAQVNLSNKGRTPLMLATNFGYHEIVELLKAHGAQ